MQTKDVTNDLVYACFETATPNVASGVLEALQARGVPLKVAVAKLELMVDAGLLEYGTSINWVWLTERGRIHAETAKAMKAKGPTEIPKHPGEMSPHQPKFLTEHQAEFKD